MTDRDDSRLSPLEVFFKSRDLQRDLNQALETLSSGFGILSLVLRVSLNVHPDSGSLTARPAQPEDNARTIGEGDDVSLVLRDATVNGVSVGEVIDLGDNEFAGGRGVSGGDEVGVVDEIVEVRDKFLSPFR